MNPHTILRDQEIKAKFKEGASIADLCRKFGLQRSVVERVVMG